MQIAETSLELLNNLKVHNLYEQLVAQLNKDFQLAHINERFQTSIFPQDLTKGVYEILLKLLTTNYDAYLNLVYRIDISEKELAQVSGNTLPEIGEQLTFLILKREYQKVWFKNKF